MQVRPKTLHPAPMPLYASRGQIGKKFRTGDWKKEISKPNSQIRTTLWSF